MENRHNNQGEGWSNAAVRESSNMFNSMHKEAKKNKRWKNLPPNIVHSTKFYDSGPEEFVADVLKQNGEGEYFFSTLRKRRSPASITACRKAGGGTWKQNGRLNKILDDGGEHTGYQRFFEYENKTGDKTSWRLYEYEEHNPLVVVDPADKIKGDYVLCKLYKISSGPSHNNCERKSGKRKSGDEGERAAKLLDNINHQFPNQNPALSHFQSQTSKGNGLISFPKPRERLAIEDILGTPADNPAGASGDKADQLEYTPASDPVVQFGFAQAGGNPAGVTGDPAALFGFAHAGDPAAQFGFTQAGNPAGVSGDPAVQFGFAQAANPAAQFGFAQAGSPAGVTGDPAAQFGFTQAGNPAGVTGDPAALFGFAHAGDPAAQFGFTQAGNPAVQFGFAQAANPAAQFGFAQGGSPAGVTGDPAAQFGFTQVGVSGDPEAQFGLAHAGNPAGVTGYPVAQFGFAHAGNPAAQFGFAQAGNPVGVSGDPAARFGFTQAGDPAAQFEFLIAGEDYYKLTESDRSLVDADEWVNSLLDGVHD